MVFAKIYLDNIFSRYEKLGEGELEEKFVKSFSNSRLSQIVSRVRRENKIFRLNNNKAKLKKRENGRILRRCNYVKPDSVQPDKMKYSFKILLEPRLSYLKLLKPSLEEIKRARNMSKIPEKYKFGEEQVVVLQEAVKEMEKEQKLVVQENVKELMEEESSILSDIVDSSQNLSTDDVEKSVEVETVVSNNVDDNFVVGEDMVKENLSKLKCSKLDCRKEFSTKNGLDYHERTHLGLSPFVCDLCNKKFKSSSLCSRHKLIHSSSKKYMCTVCDKRFAQRSNLTKHLDIHSGVKAFGCSSCSRSFTQKVHLDNHILTHFKVKPWECDKCGSKFSKKSSLSRHDQHMHEKIEEEGKESKEIQLSSEDSVTCPIEVGRTEPQQEKLVSEDVNPLPIEDEKTDLLPSDLVSEEIKTLPIEETRIEHEEGRQDLETVVLGEVTAKITEENSEDISNLNGDDYDVEVTYCDDIEMLQNVEHQTLLIIDDLQQTNPVVVPENDINISKIIEEAPIAPVVIEEPIEVSSPHAENLEDIQKFLNENPSITEETIENIGKMVASETEIDKSCKGTDSRKDPIKFTKESALKIISQSTFFVKNNVANGLTNSKPQSFEDALNAATSTCTKKPVRAKISKNSKSNKRAVLLPSKTEHQPSKILKSSSKKQSVLSPKKTVVTSKAPESSSKKNEDSMKLTPVQKTNSFPKILKKVQKSPEVKSNLVSKLIAQQSKTAKLQVGVPTESKPKIEAVSIKQEKSVKQAKLKTPSYEEIYQTLKKNILNNDIKPKPTTVSTSPGKDPTKVLSTKDKKLFAELPCPVPSRGADVKGFQSSSGNSNSSNDLPHMSSEKNHVSNVLSKLSSEKNLVSNRLSPVKRSESQGYYTSSSKTSPSKDLSKDLWMKHEVTEAKTPTLLPSVFPTFDSPSASSSSTSNSFSNLSLSGISSIIQGSKPTAVVPPSSRPKMPVLPKPVPAALGK